MKRLDEKHRKNLTALMLMLVWMNSDILSPLTSYKDDADSAAFMNIDDRMEAHRLFTT